MNKIKIDKQTIGKDQPCFIIAEISANHNQNFEKAKKLIRLAKECGANAVKFQTYKPDTITLDCDNEYFQIKNGPWKGQTLYELYKKAFTPWEWQAKLKQYADDIGITFFSTPFDQIAVDFLEDLQVPAYKIASFELVDIPLIRYVATKKKPIIISTGMGTLADIELAINTIRSEGNNQIILLKCTSAYPAVPEEMNLKKIITLKNTFNTLVGISDHSLSNEASLVAIAIGATVIEKHFIDDRKSGGPDAPFSLDYNEFKRLVKSVRLAEKILGKDSNFTLTKGENSNKIFRKSVFTIEDIQSGEVFSKKNIRCIRPAYGLHPKYYDTIIGKRAARDIKRGTPIDWGLVDQG